MIISLFLRYFNCSPWLSNAIMMPLYDDDSSTDKGSSVKKASWSQSSGIKLLQDHLQAKKRISQNQSIDGSYKSSPIVGNQSTKSRSTVITASIHNTHSAGSGSMLGGDWDPNDEYDPMWPNEYEVLQRQYLEEEEKRRTEEYELRQRNKQLSGSPKSGLTMLTALRGMQDYDEDDDDDDNVGHKSSARANRGTAIAPPPLLTSSSSSITVKTENSSRGGDSSSANVDPSISVISSKFGVSSVAAQIMSKMGYKEGQGLGKDEQGISRALEVEKISSTSGKIIAEPKASGGPSVTFMEPAGVLRSSSISVANKTAQPPTSDSSNNDQQEDKKESISEILKSPTRVILLRNMVGPGEVDDDLESETKEECSKYGEVIKCLIFEIPNKKVPDDEAVRIFLEFRRVESAIKAVVDLNGRYFGGRVVKASFYEVDKFNKFELAPTQLIKR